MLSSIRALAAMRVIAFNPTTRNYEGKRKKRTVTQMAVQKKKMTNHYKTRHNKKNK